MEDQKFSPTKFDSTCNYLNVNLKRNHFPTQFILNMKNYCRKMISFIDFSKKQIDSYNHTAHKILMKEMSLILPNFAKDRKEKRSIIALLVTRFISLAYEGISSYLKSKRQEALDKAFMAMENKMNIEWNKIFFWKILW